MNGSKFILIIFIITCVNLYAEGASYSLDGYYKSFFTVLRDPDIRGSTQKNPPDASVNNTFRLKLGVKPSERYSLNLAYSLSPNVRISSSNLSSITLFSSAAGTYRAVDLPERLYTVRNQDQTRFSILQNLDRANMVFSTSYADFTIGRQSIAFGSSKIINPTDILTPFMFSVFDKEERVGIDAVRINIPTARMGELDIGYVFGEDLKFSNSAAFIKFKFYKWNTDISTILISFRNNLLLGFDVARNIMGASVWLEVAYTFANVMKNYMSSDNYFRLSTGIDYNLTGGLYSYIEYHYNDAGISHIAGYTSLLATTAYSDGSVYLLGRHYLIPGLMYELTALLRLSSQLLINLNDPSTFFSLVLAYSFSDNVSLDFGTYVSLGRNPVAVSSNFIPKSEFGMYPTVFFSSIRLYF